MLAMKRRRRGLSAREQVVLRRSIRKLVGPDKRYTSARLLADAIGWDVSSLTRAARGESGGSWEMFEHVARQLETTPEQLLGEAPVRTIGIIEDLTPLARRHDFEGLLAQAQKVADFDDRTWTLVGEARLPLSEDAELSVDEIVELAKLINTHKKR